MKPNFFYTYKKVNSGSKTVLLLHGWGDSSNTFFDLKQQLLQDGYNVLLVDFLGFGKSPDPSVIFDTYLYALSIYDLLLELKLQSKDLLIVCHSFGGRVASVLCALFDLKITKLVMVASAGIASKKNLITKVKIATFKLCKKLVIRGWLPYKLLNKFGSSDYKALQGVMKHTFVNVVNEDIRYLLPNIKIKTLIIYGSKDKATPKKFGKIFNKLIANSKLVLVKGAGHFLHQERKFLFNKLVLDFFKTK